MTIELVKINLDEVETLWNMQVLAFQDLFNKYQDTDTSPAKESIDKLKNKINQPFTYFYFIQANNKIVGAIRVVDKHLNNESKRIAPIFIMPSFRNRGIAKQAIKLAEERHGKHNWELDTIMQETTTCKFYEKIGYYATGKTTKVNDKMTIVYYKKD